MAPSSRPDEDSFDDASPDVHDDHAEVRRRPNSPIAKGVAFVLLGAGALHLGATALWLTPSNPVRTAAASQIDGYLEPFFHQAWQLFAPNPMRSDEHLLVRARISDTDTSDLVETDWFDVTAFETAHLRHNPTPSRLVKTSTSLYHRYGAARRGLTDEQRDVLYGDFSDGDWDRMEAELSSADPGTSSASVISFIRADQGLSAYSTAVARAVWGDEIVAVQVRLRSQRVVAYDRRDDGTPPAESTITLGWRPLWWMGHHDQDVFDSIFAGARR